MESFKAKEAVGEASNFLMGAREVGGLKVLTATLPNADAAKLRQMGDMLRDKQPNVVAVLSAVNDGKITFLAVCGKEAVSKGVKLVTSSRMSPPSAAARAAASRTAPWAEEMTCSSWTTPDGPVSGRSITAGFVRWNGGFSPFQPTLKHGIKIFVKIVDKFNSLGYSVVVKNE